MYCGHFSKALEFFATARKPKIITDAEISVKATLKVKQINDYLLSMLQKDRAKILEKKSKKKNNNKILKIEGKNPNSNFEKLNTAIELGVSFSETLKNNINIFTSKPRDIIILIDCNDSMKIESKKIEKAIKVSKSIYLNSIGQGDRYGLFTFTNNITTAIKFDYKNKYYYNYVSLEHESLISNILIQSAQLINDKTVFDHISHKDNLSNTGKISYREENKLKSENSKKVIKFHSPDDHNNLINTNTKNLSITGENSKHSFKVSIFNTYSYLKKVSNHTRQKWVIIFTDNYLKKKNDANIFNIFKKDSNTNDFFNIILVGFNFNQEIFQSFSTKLTEIGNSYLLDSEHINIISEIMKPAGSISFYTKFKNEVYEAEEN